MITAHFDLNTRPFGKDIPPGKLFLTNQHRSGLRKLENISNDLWSVGVGPPYRDEPTSIGPATIGIAPTTEGGRP